MHHKDNNLSRFNKKQFIIFLLIILVGILFFMFIYNTLPSEQQRWYITLSVAYFIPPMGKETVVIVGLNRGIPVLSWSTTLWLFDILVCLALITNWWIIEALIRAVPSFPFIGLKRRKPYIYKTRVSLETWYQRLHYRTARIQSRNYGKILPLMLLLFMFIPFQGTGAMSTTIICSLLGLHKRLTLLIVGLGSMLTILSFTLPYYAIINL
ncbi:MAG: small multi-drug export protein [Candidatus Thermoplasmatota archaeon]